MPQLEPNLLWTQREWIDQAQAWIEQALVEAGLVRTSPFDQFHVQLWSTLMRFSTEAGVVYFKACEPPTEPRLTHDLKSIQPENIPDLIAVDLERGWMLMHDAGPMLRTVLKQPADLQLVAPALPLYAQLQIAVSDQPERFLEMGAMDRRLQALPGMFEALLADPQILRLGEADGLAVEQHQQLLAIQPTYREMCARLQSYPVPQTLHHDDFHDGNIFISGPSERLRYVFSDWGESAVAHPFFSIMMCLRIVGWRAGLPDEATEAPDRMPPELNRLRDAYLQPWQGFAGMETLIEIFNLAWRVGMVSRAVTWGEYVGSLEVSQRTELTHIVPAWLSEFLLAMK